MRERTTAGRRAPGAALLALALIAGAGAEAAPAQEGPLDFLWPAGRAKVHVLCEPEINDGLLLTIDMVFVDEGEQQEIRQAGDQWFYSPRREELRDRIETVSVEGGCNLRKTIPGDKDRRTLAVIADFQAQTAEPTRGNVLFLERKMWKRRGVDLRVHNNYMSAEKSR